MAKREFAIHQDFTICVEGGKFVDKHREREVRVLARAEGWAMVRIKGGSTFAVPEKQLRPRATDSKESGAALGERDE